MTQQIFVNISKLSVLVMTLDSKNTPKQLDEAGNSFRKT